MIRQIVRRRRITLGAKMSDSKTIILLLFVSLFYFNCDSEKVSYISVEHPRVTYYNPMYVTYANLTCRRYGRRNPVYYVGLHFASTVPFDNSIKIDIYFYEWLTNVYKPSFIELHYGLCDFIEQEKLFGAALRQGKLLKPCPYPPDQYRFENMTVNPAFIPPGFPFTRGRIYLNMSHVKTKARVGEGYIDMRVAQINKNDANKLFNNYTS